MPSRRRGSKGASPELSANSSLGHRDREMQEKKLMEFEELALNKMSTEEVEKRRAELRQMRDLMFRDELRAKRVSKIKSKLFRKIKKKERERNALTAEEMRTLEDAEILHRLFNEDDLRLFEPSPVYFRCRCSRERVAGMLQALGEQETRSVIEERGKVEVQCDFCNRTYIFDAVDVEQLFKAPVATDTGSSVH